MNTRAFSLAFLLALTLASAVAIAGGTYRAGSVVLGPGDSAMKVLENMGQPRYKEPVQNTYGAQLGEYWYYRDGNKTVRVFISGGKIVDIEEIRD